MVEKIRVYAYFDGSNFYHNIKSNYGISKINFLDFSNNMLDLSKETIVKIKYFNSPINQQENPGGYKKQQKFLMQLRSTPFVEVFLGKLVQRQLNKIHINCSKCGHQISDQLICPKCGLNISVSNCTKVSEKGVDVNLAIQMLLDALENKYDVALLFSGDADFVPAIRYITRNLKKKVVYCTFPTPKTSELLNKCSSVRLITKDAVLKSEFTH